MHPKSQTAFWRCIFYGKKKSEQKRCSAEFKIFVIMVMRENHLSYREAVRKYWDTHLLLCTNVLKITAMVNYGKKCFIWKMPK